MLYDKRWDVPIETKPISFNWESLVSWLRTMPAEESYCFTDSGQCLLAQWAASIDPQAIRGTADDTYAYTVHGRAVSLSPFYLVAIDVPRTFGAAYKRAYRINQRKNGPWYARAFYGLRNAIFFD